ncbi:hypothetical protein B0I35DRAFT_425765 [Stachybotrys elegans]|uniref:Uncharacterized protein n=1 Tax=Stachybotrys elegans TaxID=80388 RepID=A0A8K0SUZ3_9HYPO|nr:hypothetical protein B0I35DRAFT_425765 [Stachybotrys elegans]
MDPSYVQFNPTNMYAKDPQQRVIIATLVAQSAPNGAAGAVVVNGWHTSRSDRRYHCTVDYYDFNGGFLTRRHIV